MGPLNLGTLVASLVAPPLLILLMESKRLAFVLGAIWFWGMAQVGCEHALATDPEYDSIAPGLNLFFGWLFGGLYCTPWLGIAIWMRGRTKGCTDGRDGELAQSGRRGLSE